MKIANGSEDFDILFLSNFHKTENSDDIFKLLTTELELTQILAAKMVFIVTWAEEMGLLNACGVFLKLYNKGDIPTLEKSINDLEMHEEFIQSNTYFGMLLKPVYDLRQHAKQKLTAIKEAILNAPDNSLTDSNSILDQMLA